ncbi:MAG: ABC transporter permease [Deltaproteobacteria bacterium]|nr:ABC transporter permease [Deltaproteobacteria bacterium]
MTQNFIGFRTLIEREYYRFARLSKQTIAPPIITTALYIFIFGFSLGSRIKEVGGFPYIVFMLPGLAAMGVINNAYANTSTSLFMARMDRSIENILAAPLSPFQVVFAFVLGGILRGALIGILTLAVSKIFIPLPFYHFGYLLLVLLMSSLLFSCLGIISALWSESWDQIATFTNFVISPFIYLGGVFYSIHMLPPLWQKVSLLNPIFYLVDALRWATLGKGDVPFAISISFISTLALLSLALCAYLFRRGYKLLS